MKGVLYFSVILIVILLLSFVPNHIGLEFTFDYSNLLSILVTAMVGIYVASEIPKRINSNRAEVDIVIKKFESTLVNYNDLFKYISSHSRKSTLEFSELISFTDQNTTELYVLKRILVHCQIENELKLELDKLIQSDKELRALLSNSGETTDGCLVYKSPEISEIQNLIKEIEDIFWICIVKVNRK